MMAQVEKCSICNGKGYNRCPICEGRGKLKKVPDSLSINVFRVGEETVGCQACQATGRLLCDGCKGAGKIRVEGSAPTGFRPLF
jgi:RecJ-like exonuclease